MGRRRPVEGYRGEFGSGAQTKQLRRQLRRRANAGRGDCDLTWAGAHQRDEIGQTTDRQVRPDNDHKPIIGNHSDRREICHRIEGQLAVHRRALHLTRGIKQQSVAVRRCPGHEFGTQIAARTAAILDDDRLPPTARQGLSKDAADQIGWSARHKGHNQAYGTGRPGLRPRHCRPGGAGEQSPPGNR